MKHASSWYSDRLPSAPTSSKRFDFQADAHLARVEVHYVISILRHGKKSDWKSCLEYGLKVWSLDFATAIAIAITITIIIINRSDGGGGKGSTSINGDGNNNTLNCQNHFKYSIPTSFIDYNVQNRGPDRMVELSWVESTRVEKRRGKKSRDRKTGRD